MPVNHKHESDAMLAGDTAIAEDTALAEDTAPAVEPPLLDDIAQTQTPPEQNEEVELPSHKEPVPDDINTEENESSGDAPSKKRTSPLAFLLEYVELFVMCLAAILLVFSFFCRICSVSGDSMLPTLKDGQLLLVSDLFYEPKPGDIIIFHQTSKEIARFNEPIIKRVIATEGQHILIDFTTGTMHIDGVLMQENYIQLVNTLGEEIGEYRVFAEHHMQMVPSADGETHRIFETTVPEGCLFVMGDNRNNSSDSRTNVISFVDERRVLGHVICRLTPTDAFGRVD